MRISWTPGPTLGIGFQSFGSRPHCTRQELESGDLPGGVWKVAHYTRTWMLRRRPAAASLRYGRHPKASEMPPPRVRGEPAVPANGDLDAGQTRRHRRRGVTGGVQRVRVGARGCPLACAL